MDRKKIEYASIEAARDINNYVTPCSDATAPITVAALRYVADIIERELLDVEQAEIAKKTQEALHRSTTVMKEEKKVKKSAMESADTTAHSVLNTRR